MFNSFSADENNSSIKLLKKLQEQEDTAYERELIKRREQELIDEAIARELQEQLNIESNISNGRSTHGSTNQSPPPLPNKPLAYSSFVSTSPATGNYSSTSGSIHNSTPPPPRPPQSRSSSSYTSIRQPPLTTPSKSNTTSSFIPVSRPTSMPTPMLDSTPNYIATPSTSSVPVSTPHCSSRIEPSSSIQPSRTIFMPVLPPNPEPFALSNATSVPSKPASFTKIPITNTATQSQFQNSNSSNSCKDNNVPRHRISQRAATQPLLTSNLSSAPSSSMIDWPVYPSPYQYSQSSTSIDYIGSNHYHHPSKANNSSSNIPAYHVITSDQIPLSEFPPTNNSASSLFTNQHREGYQQHKSTYSDSFLALKPNEKVEEGETDPFSDQFTYHENNSDNTSTDPYKLNNEEKIQVQNITSTKKNTSHHKKSVSEPPKLQSSGPQIADDNYGYYKENIKTDIPVPTDSDERHITIASIKPGLRAWIRIHPQDTGKSLAERIHIVGSYKTQKVIKLTSKNGRNIPLDNTPIFKDWDDLKEFKEGEAWKVEWGPMPSFIDIIDEGKQFMKQLKKSFKT